MPGLAPANPEFCRNKLWPFQPNQNQPPVAFWLNGDNITLVNPRLLPGFGGDHHLTATVNGGMHSQNLMQALLTGNREIV